MSIASNPALWSSPLLRVALENIKFYYYDVWNIYGDPRVTNYPFMDGGPWATIVMICMYLYVVKIWGPEMMKNRRPYDMRNVILFYNVSLVIVNGWLHWKGTWITNFGLDSWKCQAVDRTSTSEIDLYKIKLGWLFYMTKTIDFCDTFFFVLRKKDRQISGLHVFHHSCMPFFCWIGLKFTPGGNNAFFPWLNSGVHTIMYSYYALSTFSSLRPYLWWKKYITQMQMIQFVAVIIHSFYSMLSPGCQWPKMFIYLSIFNAFIFFCMFYSFFQKTYHSSSKNCGSIDKDHQQHQYSSVSNIKSNEKSSSTNNSSPSSVYQQSTSSKLNGTTSTTCPKNRFSDGRFNYYLLSYIFQVCKPNHVNNRNNDDINNCSTDKSDAAERKSQQSAKKSSSSSVSANSSSSTSSSSKHPYHQDDDKSAHQLILNNVCISSTSTTTIMATSRSLCADPKCVKCK